MRETFLNFAPPLIGEEEIAEVVDTLRSGWITTGPKVRLFEQQFAAAVEARAALAVNSCTAAMHLALLSMGVGAGGTVITSTMTFCSTAHVIEHVGARTSLVDVEPDTLNMNPARLREAIEKHRGRGERVRAIIPVHLYGHPCDMDTLLVIADEYGLAVIEDAAHALPARYRDRIIGSARNAGVPVLTCFSFYATKNLSTGEGGMLTGPPELVDQARIWSLHGMDRDAWKRYSAEGSWYYQVDRAGYKYNMSDLQAAIGIHQLRKLGAMHQRRKEIVARYNSAFSGMEEFQTPGARPGIDHAWHLYVLRINPGVLRISRDDFIEELRRKNISASVHFIPLHMQRYYREEYGLTPSSFPVATREFERIVSLPLSPRMSDADVNDVVTAVKEIAFASRGSRFSAARAVAGFDAR